MRFCWAFFATFFVTANCKGLIIINDSDPGQCDKSNHGDQVLVLDRNNMEQVLTCSIDNGVYKWTTAGGLYDKHAGVSILIHKHKIKQ